MSAEKTYSVDNLHKQSEAHFGRNSTCSPNVAKEIEQSARVRREAGRYTLEEAAFYVEKKANARARTILVKLKKAVMNGTLTVYEPGGDEKYNPSVARGWHEEANAKDLNDWLENNEPIIGRIFLEIKNRSNKIRAFLGRCIKEKGVNPDIDSIWLYICENAGKPGFFFKTASCGANHTDSHTATTVDGKTISKMNLGRRLQRL